MDNEQPLSLRDTAKGVAVRASVLGVAGVVVAGLIASLGFKAASALIKVLVGLFLLSIFTGLGAWEVHKIKNRLGHNEGEAALQ